jgi:hypothetical protein
MFGKVASMARGAANGERGERGEREGGGIEVAERVSSTYKTKLFVSTNVFFLLCRFNMCFCLN